jgi:HK97 family phage prohead protease
MIRKTFDLQLQVKQSKVTRGFRAIASDETIVDRDNEIIRASAWMNGLTNFKANPVILYGHDCQNNLPIAKAVDIWVDAGRLMVDVEFPAEGTSQLSDECYNLVKSGILKTLSVGFMSRKHEYDGQGRKIFIDVELLEISLTPTPSNVGARILEVKSTGKQQIDLGKLTKTDIKQMVAEAIQKLSCKDNRTINNKAFDLAAIETPVEIKIKMKNEAQWQRELEAINAPNQKSANLEAEWETEFDKIMKGGKF